MLRRALLSLGIAGITASSHFACGGSIGSATADGGTPDGGSDGSVFGAIEGSYDLTFSTVAVQMPAPFGNDKPPSLARSSRVDLRKRDDGSYDAVFTSRWGRPAALAVDVSQTAVTLKGDANVESDTAYYLTDTWKMLQLARGADGKLTGAVTATGEENMTGGDVVYTSPITGSGALTHDATAPELRATLTSPNGPDNALLPWDPIQLTMAEPVAFDAIVSAFRLKSRAGADVPLVWRPGGDPRDTSSAAWAGTVSAVAITSAWGDPLAPALTLSASATIPDRVGLTTAAYASSPQFMPLPMHQTSHDFDSDVLTVGSWGTVTFLGGLAGSDPSCEHGGCVQIGPFENGVCGALRAGIAGVVESSARTLSVRYRVLLDDMGSGQPPSTYGAAFSIDGTRPGADLQSVQVNAPTGTVKKLTARVLGMGWATEWTTAELALPSSTSPLAGFTVRAGSYAGSPSCGGGGPVPQPIKTIVLVDSVTVK